MEWIQTVLLLFVFVVIGVSLYYDHKLKMPPAPTLPWVRRKMIAALKKHAGKPDMRIAELGCGWGGLLFSLARNFPQSRVDGFELSPFPYGFSKIFSIFYRRTRVRRADIFAQDLSGYDAIVYYLAPAIATRLSEKFKADLKPGTLIITGSFALPGFEPIDVLETNVGVKIEIYVYRV